MDKKVLKNAQRIMGKKEGNLNVYKNEEQVDAMDKKTSQVKPELAADIKPGSNARSDADHNEEGTDTGGERLKGKENEDAVQKRINRLVGENKSLKEKLAKTSPASNPNPPAGKEEPTNASPTSNAMNPPQLKDFPTVDAWAKAHEEHITNKVTSEVEKREHLRKLNDDIASKYQKLLENGKRVAPDHGLTPEEYESKVSSNAVSIHRAAQAHLLNSPHGHLVALDIADDLENFNKLANYQNDPYGHQQLAYIARREGYHEAAGAAAKGAVGKGVDQDRTTKASNPDRELAQGFGQLNDDSQLSTKKGDINWKAVRKTIKGRSRGY